jgi:glycosyltransferase involved in cell wall biosynthesis
MHLMATKRILFIDHTATMGGGEIALLNLIKHMDRARFTPIVLLFAEGPLAELLRPEAEVHVMALGERIAKAKKDSLGVGSFLRIGDALRIAGFAVRISRFVAEQRIDLVHTNSLKADIIGGIAARLAFRPLVWHVRDRIDADYLPRSIAWTFRKLARVIPSHVIANSEATMRTLHLRRDLSTAVPSGVDLGKMSVIHDGTLANAAEHLAECAEVRFGLIGRISPWKGQHIFLKAAALLHKENPTARFYIIGAALFGEVEYEAEIRRLAEELGLAGVVEFMGFRTDVKDVIRGLDVVVHASTTGEPFGQVIIEGMAAGKPVIATNGGGVPEIVVDGVTGMLVEMGDVEGMAGAMRWMMGNRTASVEMGRMGRERVLDGFTVEKSTLKVEEIFSVVLR